MIIVNKYGSIVNFDNIVVLLNRGEDLIGITPTGYEIHIERFQNSQIALEYVKNIRKAYSIKQTEFIIGG